MDPKATPVRGNTTGRKILSSIDGAKTMTTNLKPADELKSVRDRIKELQTREAELREGIIAGSLDAVGVTAIAFVTKQTRKTFDRKAAEAELGDLSRFERPGETIVVRVQERVYEPEEG